MLETKFDIDNAATTRKAMPVQNKSPVKNHTTIAQNCGDKH